MKTRIPRKLKKQIKKIPVGDYCYGSSIGAKLRRKDGQDYYKGRRYCPFFHPCHEKKEDELRVFCSFLSEIDDLMLTDSCKICNGYLEHVDAYRFADFEKRNRKKGK